MTDKDLDSQKAARSGGLRGHGAAIVALVALAVIAVAWFWMTRRPPQEAGIGAEHGVIAVGATALVTAIVAYVRGMDASDVLEMLSSIIMGLLSVIGAILLGIWNWFLGLIGLD
jgi:multisubunit Na+/H+ antiporter MnhB subunit